MQRGEDIPTPYNNSNILREVRIQHAKGNNIFKKTTGKKSDYWIFVNREGRKIFYNIHKRHFDCKVKNDEVLMGQIWHDLDPKKRVQYREEAQEQNSSEMVKKRRNEEALRCRAAHQAAGRLGYETRLKLSHQKDNEVRHRLAANAATELDLRSFNVNPLFYYGETMRLYSMNEYEFAYNQMTINFVEKKGEILKGVLQNQTYAIIKMNIYDSMFVSDAFKARTHPSEISLVIFNQSQGILETKNYIFKFVPKLLYGTEDVPETSYDNIVNQENKTNIIAKSSKQARKNEVSVYQGFELVQDVIEEYKAQMLISKKDWNHTMSSLFFLAHAAQCEKQFKDLRLRISLLEEVLCARDAYYQKRKEPGTQFEPYSKEQIEACVSTPMMIDKTHDRVYVCEHHLDMSRSFQANCALSRAVCVVHNIYSMWMETKFAAWDVSAKDPRFSFAKPLPSEITIVDPETNIEPVLSRMAGLNLRDLENERAISDDDNDNNTESSIFRNRDRDNVMDDVRNRTQNRSRAQPPPMQSNSPSQNYRSYSKASFISEQRPRSPDYRQQPHSSVNQSYQDYDSRYFRQGPAGPAAIQQRCRESEIDYRQRSDSHSMFRYEDFTQPPLYDQACAGEMSRAVCSGSEHSSSGRNSYYNNWESDPYNNERRGPPPRQCEPEPRQSDYYGDRRSSSMRSYPSDPYPGDMNWRNPENRYSEQQYNHSQQTRQQRPNYQEVDRYQSQQPNRVPRMGSSYRGTPSQYQQEQVYQGRDGQASSPAPRESPRDFNSGNQNMQQKPEIFKLEFRQMSAKDYYEYESMKRRILAERARQTSEK